MLSLPPAFVLSQDQTLKLKRSLNRQDHYVLTRAPYRPQASLPKIMVALINVCPPKSLFGYLSIPRKDLVAYVSLSSYSHVKEHLPKQDKTDIQTASRFANPKGRDGQRLHCRDAETQQPRQLVGSAAVRR